MNRYQAFGIHFLISLSVFVGLVILVFSYWFPGVLADVDSSWERMLLVIAGVDLVLGPILTLIVFNPAKKSLKFDLATIAVLQIAVLAYGVYSMHSTRPLGLYMSLPQMGFEILYADKVNKDLKLYLADRPEQLFFFNKTQETKAFGPKYLKDLHPENLIPINVENADAFVAYIEAGGLNFDDQDRAQFQVFSGNPITLDKTGQAH